MISRTQCSFFGD